MELRRALLLFVIVLGVAAIASSIARPPDEGDDRNAGNRPATATAPTAGLPTTPPEPTRIVFRPAVEQQARELEVGQPATVLVDVETPAEVDIPSLGLTEVAEPLTPAVFDVRVTEPGNHAITVQPVASETAPSTIGTLRVTPTSRSNRSDRTVGATKSGR